MELLKKGTYTIPEGCVVKLNGNTLTIRENRRKVITDDRCRDCKFFLAKGKTGPGPWDSPVCLNMPKKDKDGNIKEGYHYSIRPTGKICKLFQKK